MSYKNIDDLFDAVVSEEDEEYSLDSEVDDLEALADAMLEEAGEVEDEEVNEDEVNEALEDVDEAVAEAYDGRSVEDFDFAALVDSLDPVRVEDLFELLEKEKPAFAAAWRREGRKGSGTAAFYSEANDPLFRKRLALKQEIADMEERTLDEEEKWELSRSRSHLNYVDELICRLNTPLTRAYVGKFTSNTSIEDSRDFQAAANVGLMNAINNFDPDRGKFGSWAYKPIQRTVLRAVRNADYSNMTGGDFERRPQVLRAKAELAGPNEEYNPTFEEIAAHAGVTVTQVKRVLAPPYVDSLHTKVGADENTELGELIPDDDRGVEDSVISDMEIHALMACGLPVLDSRENYVLVCRYGLHGADPEALSDIGKRLGLSREAVRQIAGKAQARLGHPMVLGALMLGGRA